jgi:hypothetical protein
MQQDNGQPRPDDTIPLHRDVLIGAPAIADEIGVAVRRVYYWLNQGQIPGARIGTQWTSTRSALRRHFSGETQKRVA